MTKPTAFANWLKAELGRRSWTQADFARRLSRSDHAVAGSRVSEWTAAKRIPRPATCRLIATELNVDPDVVLAVAGHRTMPTPVDPSDPRHELHGLIDQIRWTEDRVAGVSGLLRSWRDG